MAPGDKELFMGDRDDAARSIRGAASLADCEENGKDEAVKVKQID